MSGCARELRRETVSVDSRIYNGFEIREFNGSGESYRYALFVPEGYSHSQKWPCVVFLHGSGECGRDPMRAAAVGLGQAIRDNPSRWPCLVIFPQKPTSSTEWEEHEALVLGILNDVCDDFSVDDRRISLTGLSQGGHGTWMLGARNPSRWACLAPVCGYGQATTTAPRVYQLPIWAFHGQIDSVVPVEQTERIVEAIRRLQSECTTPVAPARITVYPGVNHNSWENAYSDPELARWLLSQARCD